MFAVIDPYARLPRWYDAEYAASEQADTPFFARAIDPGSVLVIGCGTGRVARGLAPRRVVGIDRSAPMIDRARALDPAGDWRVGDATVLDPALVGFDSVLFPNAVFSFLPDRAAQAAALAGAARALRPGGTLWIDVPMPDFSRLGDAHTPELPAWSGVVDGVQVRRTREVRRAPVAQRLDLFDRWYAGDEPPIVSHLPLRLIFPDELAWMVEGAGLWVDEVFGDYAGRASYEGCPRLLMRAGR